MEDFDISMSGSDTSMPNYDDASSDSESSVDLSQARQWMEVHISRVHPAPSRFLFTDIHMHILK
jgi:hypothetical protein